MSWPSPWALSVRIRAPKSQRSRTRDSRVPVLTAGRREFALFGAVYVLYDSARWVGASSFPIARAHADRVLAIERSLHIAVEAAVQHALDSPALSLLFSNVYLAAQAIVLPGALLWLYRHSRRVYRQLRDTVVVIWLIATPIFALYPVAPPRLAETDIKDLVSRHSGISLTGHSTLFFNPYAAVPSLHVGLAFAVAVAVASSLRRIWARALVLLWGPLVTVAVVATGNHYLFDAASGLGLACLAFAVTRAATRHQLRLRAWSAAVRFQPAEGRT